MSKIEMVATKPARKAVQQVYCVDSFRERIVEAQRAYDMAKPGDAVAIDSDLIPYISQTEK
jgi:hypothetical protein